MRASTKHQSATCASDVHTFWPVITHSSPSRRAVVATAARSGPGARLGVALAPQLGHGRDRRQEARLLLRRAERDQRGPEQFLAHVADPGRGAAAGVLLVEDDLLRERGVVAAVAGGPAQAGPAGRGQVPVPGHPLGVGLVLAAGTARAAQPGEAPGEVLRQPLPYTLAEFLVLRAEPHRPASVSGQRLAPARRLTLPSTCFAVPGPRSRGVSPAARTRAGDHPGRRGERGAASSATRPRWPSRAGPGSATASCTSGSARSRGR